MDNMLTQVKAGGEERESMLEFRERKYDDEIKTREEEMKIKESIEKNFERERDLH